VPITTSAIDRRPANRVLAATLACGTFCMPCAAEPPMEPVKLSCVVIAEGFPDLEDGAMASQPVLTAPRHEPGGTHRLQVNGPYSFWVFSNVVASNSQLRTILDFEVAIKDGHTGLFAQASSRPGRNGGPARKARVSLVRYRKDMYFKEATLLLECVERKD